MVKVVEDERELRGQALDEPVEQRALPALRRGHDRGQRPLGDARAAQRVHQRSPEARRVRFVARDVNPGDRLRPPSQPRCEQRRLAAPRRGADQRHTGREPRSSSANRRGRVTRPETSLGIAEASTSRDRPTTPGVVVTAMSALRSRGAPAAPYAAQLPPRNHKLPDRCRSVSYAAVGGPNQVASASVTPTSVPSPTQAT